MHRAFAQDPISKKILLSQHRWDISGTQTHYLSKIDVTVDPPVQEWFQYALETTSPGTSDPIFEIIFTPNGTLFYDIGVMKTLYAGTWYRTIAVSYFNSTTGKFIDLRNMETTIDSNDNTGTFVMDTSVSPMNLYISQSVNSGYSQNHYL